jgi:hypothetical protein
VKISFVMQLGLVGARALIGRRVLVFTLMRRVTGAWAWFVGHHPGSALPRVVEVVGVAPDCQERDLRAGEIQTLSPLIQWPSFVLDEVAVAPASRADPPS